MIRDEGEKMTVRLEALRIYLHRGWGKPQFMNVTQDDGRPQLADPLALSSWRRCKSAGGW